ncbi:MAG: methylmalonyl-CoA mutase family protein [Chloroflexi bacterium]|nr:methylmalonyl-CoA mutase family protein [Chloroflexota bacterium]MCZ6706435.1 methylmalonyl-CoA mutase family protein [Chloroflexota bacterium]
MFDAEKIGALRAKRQAWDAETDAAGREQPGPFMTVSSRPIERLYGPTDLDDQDFDYERELGNPGEYPFTRGIHATGYRGRPWTMRMFAGFGSAEETNQRFKQLLDDGQTGLSIAFDMPTLMGYDHDDPLSEGEFGKCGVAVDSLPDMEILLDGLPLDTITTSMTINSPASVIWAMYIAAAEKRGIDRAKLGGTLQNDILKEYIAQNEYRFPPKPSMRLVTDTIEFAAAEMPKWNSVSVSGYHIREAGSTAAQELAFTLADGFEYVRWALERGMDVDDFAPRLSFFFNSHNDFFEEVAKFRAARRIWAREMKETFGAKSPRSWWMRFHTQTAGVSLTGVQPEVNLMRVTIQALAAAMGGTQSLHTDAMDEALALPSEKAARLALRTQQVVLHESGVTNTVDPLGGSYFVETLTNEIEKDAYEYFRSIEALGGVVPAIEAGFFQREIADAAHRFQREIETHDRVIVGINAYQVDEPVEIPILQMDPEGEARHLERLRQTRAERNADEAQAALAKLANACADPTANTMPHLLDAASALCTVGEIMGTLSKEFGEHRETVVV